MKVYINGQLHDCSEELIAIVFENDEDRKRHATNILTMPEKPGKRGYAGYPDSWSPDKVEQELKPVREILES